jgi:hypothetical protein
VVQDIVLDCWIGGDAGISQQVRRDTPVNVAVTGVPPARKVTVSVVAGSASRLDNV